VLWDCKNLKEKNKQKNNTYGKMEGGEWTLKQNE
jgi:hypothetical protein